jgi:hypothetical protein
MSLTIVTKAAATIVDLTTAKDWLRIDNTDEDRRIQLLIDAAVEYVERHSRMQLSPATMLLTLDGFPVINWYQYFPVMAPFPQLLTQGLAFFLPTQTVSEPVYPVTAISWIKYKDQAAGAWTTLAASEYTVDLTTGRQVPAANKVWPGTQNAICSVQIQFTAGFVAGTVPKWAVVAILNHCLLSYYNPAGIPEKDIENLNKSIEANRQNLLV